MHPTPVIAVFDIGKTNKKLLLFDEQYHVVWERSDRLEETVDEDGMPCEDLSLLQQWLQQAANEVLQKRGFAIRAMNFAAYGASFVYLDEGGVPQAPVYNYLKPYPEGLLEQFFNLYGDPQTFAVATASPLLGSLNSGLQLYRLKQEQEKVFAHTGYALHLPQYASYLFTRQAYSDITSIGCHTALWDFEKNKYHHWVAAEGWNTRLPLIQPADATFPLFGRHSKIKVGIGLHDSSAALIPYLLYFKEPFILLSTGTWCIALNPNNQQPLTFEELQQDCLCYLSYTGQQVKASRLFAGNEHEQQTRRIAEHFGVATNFYEGVRFDEACFATLRTKQNAVQGNRTGLKESGFAQRQLHHFAHPSDAYHQLVWDMVQQQYTATMLVSEEGKEHRLFVDGGFSKNEVYMHALAAAFKQWEVYAAAMPQATALGAALVLHHKWSRQELPPNLIQLKRFRAPASVPAT